jgi:hypothetical protein
MKIEYFHRFTNKTNDLVIFVGRLSPSAALLLSPRVRHFSPNIYDNSVAEINYQAVCILCNLWVGGRGGALLFSPYLCGTETASD